MKRIYLRNIKKYAIVDNDDYDKLIKFSWHGSVKKLKSGKSLIYARRSINKVVNGKRLSTTISMHIEIMGKKIGMVTDHINRNGLDNRKSNLRIVSHSLSNINKKFSKFTCVYKSCQRYYSKIRYNGIRYHLGTFDTPKEAFAAYQTKQKELYGGLDNLLTPNERK